MVSRLTLEHTQIYIYCVLRVLPPRVGMATHLRLLKKLRMYGAVPPLSMRFDDMVLNQAQGQLYFYVGLSEKTH